MKRKGILITLALVLAVGVFGCGNKNVPPPEIKEGTTVVIAPFYSKEPGVPYDQQMSMLIPYTVGTQLEIGAENVTWIYDKSAVVRPVSEYLETNKISPQDIFTSPELAAKVAKGFGADLIITGSLKKPGTAKKENNQPVYDKTKSGARGSDRFTLIYQNGWMEATINIIDAKTAKPIWSTKLKSGVKYVRAYMAQSPDRPTVPESQIFADLRKNLSKRIMHALYPDLFPDAPYPELVEAPKQTFITSGGELKFE